MALDITFDLSGVINTGDTVFDYKSWNEFYKQFNPYPGLILDTRNINLVLWIRAVKDGIQYNSVGVSISQGQINYNTNDTSGRSGTFRLIVPNYELFGQIVPQSNLTGTFRINQDNTVTFTSIDFFKTPIELNLQPNTQLNYKSNLQSTNSTDTLNLDVRVSFNPDNSSIVNNFLNNNQFVNLPTNTANTVPSLIRNAPSRVDIKAPEIIVQKIVTLPNLSPDNRLEINPQEVLEATDKLGPNSPPANSVPAPTPSPPVASAKRSPIPVTPQIRNTVSTGRTATSARSVPAAAPAKPAAGNLTRQQYDAALSNLARINQDLAAAQNQLNTLYRNRNPRNAAQIKALGTTIARLKSQSASAKQTVDRLKKSI